MKKTKYSVLEALALLTAANFVHAQDGPFTDGAVDLRVRMRRLPMLAAKDAHVTTVQLEPTLRPANATDQGNVPIGKREEVGYVRQVIPGTIPPPQWAKLPDGAHVWKLELHSPGAEGLRVHFAEPLEPGLNLRVYDSLGGTVRALADRQVKQRLVGWWAPTIFGDTIGIEFHIPSGTPIPPAVPTIDQVAYLFPCQCHDGFPPGNPLACHNDISCSNSWKTAEGRAVAVMYFVPTGGTCARCTGALLNRQPGDLSPMFMTANHCLSTQAEADTTEFFWLHETPSCNGAGPNLNDADRTDGALLLKRNPATDFILLGLYEPPATNVYIGWDAGSWSSGGNATGVHHPRGSFKRISFGSSAGSSENVGFDADNDGDADFFVDVWDVSYTNGTTEPGSSGSPIFDAARRMRGTLTGGLSGCATITAYYGRFSDAFARLKYFLEDVSVASPVHVDGGEAGDPGQAGTTERGTAANPFNTVYEATFAVRSNDRVLIEPGTYRETFVLWRPMTLERSGATGSVVIGP